MGGCRSLGAPETGSGWLRAGSRCHTHTRTWRGTAQGRTSFGLCRKAPQPWRPHRAWLQKPARVSTSCCSPAPGVSWPRAAARLPGGGGAFNAAGGLSANSRARQLPSVDLGGRFSLDRSRETPPTGVPQPRPASGPPPQACQAPGLTPALTPTPEPLGLAPEARASPQKPGGLGTKQGLNLRRYRAKPVPSATLSGHRDPNRAQGPASEFKEGKRCEGEAAAGPRNPQAGPPGTTLAPSSQDQAHGPLCDGRQSSLRGPTAPLPPLRQLHALGQPRLRCNSLRQVPEETPGVPCRHDMAQGQEAEHALSRLPGGPPGAGRHSRWESVGSRDSWVCVG